MSCESLTRERTLELLKAARRVLIMTHLRPDGDALGSSFGLREFLRSQGKAAEVLLPDGLPERYRKFCTGQLAGVAPAELETYDLVVLLDCANPARAGSGALALEELKKRNFLSIDHHPFNTINAAQQFLDTAACSASGIAAELALASGAAITPLAATYWLAGMMTDTGCFRFSNTDGAALHTAARLLDLGADLERVVNTLFFSKPLRQLRFEADLIDGALKLALDDQFAYAYISSEMLERHHFQLREDEGLIDILRGVDTVKIAMLVHRQPDGFKISLRSKDRRYPVRPLASRFGGGGHDMAAGATIDLPTWEEVEQLMLREIGSLLENR